MVVGLSNRRWVELCKEECSLVLLSVNLYISLPVCILQESHNADKVGSLKKLKYLGMFEIPQN